MWLLLPQFHPVAVTVEILVPGKGGEWNGYSFALTVSSPNLPLLFPTWKASSLSCYPCQTSQGPSTALHRKRCRSGGGTVAWLCLWSSLRALASSAPVPSRGMVKKAVWETGRLAVKTPRTITPTLFSYLQGMEGCPKALAGQGVIKGSCSHQGLP